MAYFKSFQFFSLLLLLFVTGLLAAPLHSSVAFSNPAQPNQLSWTHLSTSKGDLPLPSSSIYQPAALIFDIDKDGINDFVIASRREAGSAVVWYQRHATGWNRLVIDDTVLDIEAGGAFHDIDADGDLDLVLGGDSRSNQIWWWENPYPTYTAAGKWTRRLIKDDGATKHHDMIFGDFDGDGQAEFVFWNQRSKQLFLAEVPADPRQHGPWPYTEIYRWSGDQEHEGLAQADVDGDGLVDLIGGGRWFKFLGNQRYQPEVIDADQHFTQAAVGQLKAGGRPEIVFSAGDWAGPLRWYEWDGQQWVTHNLLPGNIDHGHSLAVADMNGDGFLDIFAAEMRLNGDNPDAKSWIFLGDGTGNFTQTVVATGLDNHESSVGDLDGDGDLDILSKPWNWQTPGLDIWLNNHVVPECDATDARWQRHLIESAKPWRTLFVTSADINRDGHVDVITGGWWYQHPGTPGGNWLRHPIGAGLNNMALVADFDRDGDPDILGTGGEGNTANATFVWARNDGAGNFTLLNNIDGADGNFLQGVTMAPILGGDTQAVVLSWHDGRRGLQTLTVPADPATQQWRWQKLTNEGRGEDLQAGDIDRDGQLDLLLGTEWLRNQGGDPPTWQPFTLHPTTAEADRNALVDLNGDGRLDAVVGYEAVNTIDKVAWYAQGVDATAPWTEHLIAEVIGPMSLAVVDMDNDGDLDVVVGEHYPANPGTARMLLFENRDGLGTSWREQLIYQGDEHHAGAHVVDIDGDGDQDVVSIGWTSNQVVLYENQQDCAGAGPTPIPTPLPTATPGPRLPPQAACGASGLQAHYNFTGGSGTTVADVSGIGEPLDLTIQQAAHVRWLSGQGLEIHTPTLIASAGPATKVINASQRTQAFTVEAWIKPALLEQQGPARIITLSADIYQRNFTLGQDLSDHPGGAIYDARMRTAATDDNGQPSLRTLADSVAVALAHVVYTHSPAGERKFFLNGIELQGTILPGDFANWDPTFRLALGSELDGNRQWLGELHRVAFYNCVMAADMVGHHHRAGPAMSLNQHPTARFTVVPVVDGSALTMRFDATSADDMDGTLQTYHWTFGDGTTATGVTVEHTYPAPGSYTITLAVTDNEGATATNTQPLNVEQSGFTPNMPPVAHITPNVTEGTAPLTVTFAGGNSLDHDGTVVGHDWTLGDGATSTAPTVVHNYTASGLFTITLVVTDDEGATGRAATVVKVHGREGSPVITAHPLPKEVEIGASVTFTVATPAPDPLTYQWLRNDLPIAGATGPTYTVAPVSISDHEARFACLISNQQGSTVSQSARLRIRTLAARQVAYLPLVHR